MQFMQIAYLNNKFTPLNRAKVSILDRGFLYGDGAFETMRAYRGVVFGLEKHIARLFRSLKVLHIDLDISLLRLQKIIYELLDKNKLSSPYKKNAYIKLIVTRGSTRGLLIPSSNARPTIAIYVLPQKQIPRSVYEKGLVVSIAKGTNNEKSPTSGHKTLNYLNNILYRYDAKKKGMDDAILLNAKGDVSEASSSNIFLVSGKKLLTPCLRSGILPGIIRAEIISIANRLLGYDISDIFVSKQVLYRANEIFLTNSTAGIMPVVKIDRHIVGNGKPGRVTKEIMGLFKATVEKHCLRHT